MAKFLTYLNYFLVHPQDSASFSKNCIGWFYMLLPDGTRELLEAIMTSWVSGEIITVVFR